MHHSTRFHWLLTLLLGLSCFSVAQASHLQGGEITYASIASTTVGVPRYHITVRKFVNVIGNPGAFDPTIELDIAMNGCYVANAANTSWVNMPYTSSSYGPLCNSTSTIYQIALYEIDVNLPVGSWRLSTYSNARVAAIQNITNSGATNLYLEAHIESALNLQDTSPKFESILEPVVSPTALARYSFSTFDIDGDSLRYEQLVPYGNCNQPVPGTIPTHYNLSAATGAYEPMLTSASTQGYYNTAVRVSEYRRMNGRWALLGYVMRDYLYLIQATTNQPPTFTSMQVNGGVAQALTSAIAATRGQTVNVLLQATDPDAGQTIRFASEAPNVVPGLSLTRVGTTNGLQLTWQVPATLPPGRYAIAVGVFDNLCPSGSEERTLVFVVGGGAALAARTGVAALAEAYPTPFREQVQFQTAPNQAVVLFDALGREVARLTSPADGLVRWQPATTLPAGLYLARAADTGQPLARLLRAE